MQLTKFIPAKREDVYVTFIDPRKLEQWCYPEGFSLSVPEFEAQAGGKYRYIHTGPDGVYNCIGSFKELIPNEKLVTRDETVTAPDGKKLFENLKGSVSFRDMNGGTEVTVMQEGFNDVEAERMCEQGWIDSLNHLTDFLNQGRSEKRRPSGEASASSSSTNL